MVNKKRNKKFGDWPCNLNSLWYLIFYLRIRTVIGKIKRNRLEGEKEDNNMFCWGEQNFEMEMGMSETSFNPFDWWESYSYSRKNRNTPILTTQSILFSII